MISRPTTEQLLRNVASELESRIHPAMTDPGLAVVVEMLQQLVVSCAVRSAHEIAWLKEEQEAMVAYAADVAAALPGTEAVQAALDAWEQGRDGGLHLDQVVADYSLAGEALSCALEAALAAGHPELSARASALIAARVERETQVRGDFVMSGRG